MKVTEVKNREKLRTEMVPRICMTSMYHEAAAAITVAAGKNHHVGCRQHKLPGTTVPEAGDNNY